MNKLSPEIISIIFIHSLPIPGRHYYEPGGDPAALHSKICSVSQFWNQVALSTPQLWTYIEFDVGRRSHAVMRRRVGLSKSQPLTVAFLLEGPGEWDVDALISAKRRLVEEEALQVARDEAWRWSSLKIKGFLAAPSELWIWAPQPLPMLLEFNLCVGYEDQSEELDKSRPFLFSRELTCCYSDQMVSIPKLKSEFYATNGANTNAVTRLCSTCSRISTAFSH